ncbi:MAG: tRNA (adenosine(37)-N6)-threonylcarbamoyltransferase complex ATPase subunit type 1 TsaE [Actinomycetota bacterium]|nr:tRNA (adenosine(37)-N6)-threonylcarbamoyltransferase complex ATPase subunit type 1 TsaE [Actinomycetota bacterium]
MTGPRRCETDRAERTEQLGIELAQTLAPGDVVLIEGEIGAGKTTFVRGACRALGVTAIVSSPTFTIGQRYEAPVTVAHLDLFRLENLDDEDPALLDDYVGPDMITFIEWPGAVQKRLAGLEVRLRRVRLEHAGGDRRTVVLG